MQIAIDAIKKIAKEVGLNWEIDKQNTITDNNSQDKKPKQSFKLCISEHHNDKLFLLDYLARTEQKDLGHRDDFCS